ncbi:MAG: BrnT family toxin [Treponematales bacterium]|jgi:uncharacterized DUF497 family protein
MHGDVYYQDRFVWNRDKALDNIAKHHISFEAASAVFDDPYYIEYYDTENSVDEARYRVIGVVTGFVEGRFITVSVTYRDDLIRIFSARKAEPNEIRSYNEHIIANFG